MFGDGNIRLSLNLSFVFTAKTQNTFFFNGYVGEQWGIKQQQVLTQDEKATHGICVKTCLS